MARAPKPPPLANPMVDKEGRLTPEWYRYLTGGDAYSVNVNRAAAQAAAAAAAAQTAANAASQTAQAAPANSFVVTANSSLAEVISATTGILTTSSVTVTPSGGTAPYTYLWTYVSGDVVTITSNTAASTTFSADPGINGTLVGEYKCTVTDNVAATASITIGVAIANILITG